MPISNSDTSATWAFHNATKYLAGRNADGEEQFLMGTPPNLESPIWQEDWSLEPFPFKIYETLPPIALPREFPISSLSALDAIARTGGEPDVESRPDRAVLARVALLSNGLLNRRQIMGNGRVLEFRASGGTGARYHLELYFVCADLPDLAAGIYHYAAHDHSLRQLRAGDYRGKLVDATGDEPSIASAPVVLAMTSTFWRNAWRYKGRAYRHTYWDAGTTFANVLAVAASAGQSTRLVLGYADALVNELLGVDGTREAAVALCAIGGSSAPVANAPPVTPLDYATRPISPREVEFPIIPMLHGASSLASGAEAAAWRAEPLLRPLAEPRGDLIPLQPLSADRLVTAPIEEIIGKRRSTRHYDTDVPISFAALSTLLDRSSRGAATDCLDLVASSLHDAYLIVNQVEGLAPGIYRHHPRRGAIELLKEGDVRRSAQRLAVEQSYASDAHVNIYYLTDLTPVLERYGNRGYRLAQLECSLYAGKLHLGTHGLGLGAVGSTSFDDEVIEFFSLAAVGASYMFVTVFGQPRRRAT